LAVRSADGGGGGSAGAGAATGAVAAARAPPRRPALVGVGMGDDGGGDDIDFCSVLLKKFRENHKKYPENSRENT
jgi:hypothetical protein